MVDTFASSANIERMTEILSTDSAESEKPIGPQVRQCLHNLIEIIQNVIWNNEFQLEAAVQWGVNLGRIQELLKFQTSLWKEFEQLFLKRKWAIVETKVRTYLTVLRMEQPTIKFVRT